MTGIARHSDRDRTIRDGHLAEADFINGFRPVTRGDVAALKAVIEANDLFPGDMLDAMLTPYFDGDAAGDIWLTNAGDACLVGYCAPERMTEGTWNVLLMAVCPEVHGRGYGGALLRAIETELRIRSARVVLVETSALDSFARTRRFYQECGYDEEARIREFYAAGEDKVVFRKALRVGGLTGAA